MSQDTIRIGIIGAGANTRARHIPGLRALADVEIVGVVNRSWESSQRAARELGIPKAYATWKDLVDDDAINAVVIGTWPYLHAVATVAALARGKHVLCEARMAAHAAEARVMLDAARRRPDLVAQIVPAPFTFRVDRTIQRLLAEGFLGRLLVVEVRAGGGFLDLEAPLHWRQDADLSGVNVMSLGIWYESIMRWVGEAVRVTALSKVFVTTRTDDTGRLAAVRVPDHLDVLADLAAGAQARFQISGVTGLAGPAEVLLFGTLGTLRFSEDKLYGGRKGDAALRELDIRPEEAGHWRVEEEFIGAIRGREPITHTTFQDGVKYMEFTEAVARSRTGGHAVCLPLDDSSG